MAIVEQPVACGPTLDDVLRALDLAVARDGHATCPVCGERMALSRRARELACAGCGAELDAARAALAA